MAPSLQLYFEANTLIQEQNDSNHVKSSWLIITEILTVTWKMTRHVQLSVRVRQANQNMTLMLHASHNLKGSKSKWCHPAHVHMNRNAHLEGIQLSSAERHLFLPALY